MPRRDDGDSKQGLVVALVAFVILFVLAAVIAFLGYSDSHAYSKELAEKSSLLEAEKKKLNKERALRGVWVIAGLYNEKDKKALDKNPDVVSFDALKRENRAAIDEEVKRLTGIVWEPGVDRPTISYAEKIAQLEGELAAAVRAKNLAIQEKNDTEKRLEADVKAIKDGRGAVEKELAELKNVFAAKLKGIDDNYLAVVKKFEESIVDSGKYTKEIEQLKKERNLLAAQHQALLRDTAIKIQNLEAKIPQQDLLSFEQPKGKIVQMDRGGSLTYINLGSADLARPGLTFSVFGVGDYKPNADRKGSVEIINVISDHLSSARITEVRTPTRDPLLTGDLLYNPAWSPGVKQHVAVAGLIDLTGDGKDGTLEFIRNLEKQGVVVDAYLDIKDMEIRKRNEGISRATNYLILGDVPDFSHLGQLRDNDPRAELKLKINEKITSMHEEATKLGVNVVPARRYMTIVGYKLPRTRASQTDWDSYLITSRPGANGGGANMAKPEMKKEEKKD